MTQRYMDRDPRSCRVSVVFDRDGTLVDWSEMFLRFVLDLHRQERVRPPLREEILGVAYWQAIMGGELYIGSVRVRDRVDDVVRRYMHYATLYPGVAATLTALAAAGVRMALVSAWVGTGPTTALLERHGVRHHFASVLTRDDLSEHERDYDDVTAKSTLAGRALMDMKHLASNPLYVVGDSPADVQVGRILQAGVVGVRTGNGVRLRATAPEGPDVLLASAASLGRLLLGKKDRTDASG
ncbi:HAD hydrolase-like protein [Streptomyces sp. NPDC093085]|uniref:HAD family hydrolase n=1 Tax=Streptomyces sp. NPDC093085 TaxID=3155068 RepID=UPI0034163AA9